MGLFDSITNVADKAIDKIPSENDRNNAANQALLNSQAVDIAQANKKVTKRDAQFWLEIVCSICFTYTYLLAPILDDIFHLNLKGIQNEAMLDNLLYGMLGLGGMRVATTILTRGKK